MEIPEQYRAMAEYAQSLSEEFRRDSGGYDADEDPGYFQEWLIERLYRLEKPDPSEK